MPNSPWASAPRSTPVEKARPSPVMTTTRTAGRAPIVATTSLRSRAKLASPALSTSGRSRVRRATGPVTSRRIVLGLAMSQWFTIKGLVTPLIVLLCLLSLSSTFSLGEFPAMIGILCGTVLIGVLPSSLAWNWALLVTCAPQLIGLLALPALLRALPRHPAPGPKPLFARQAATGPDARAASITPTAALAFVAGGAIAVAYSTVEQFAIPLRGSREFGLERAGVARLLLVMQVFDIAALLPLGVLADRRGTGRVLVAVLLVMA